MNYSFPRKKPSPVPKIIVTPEYLATLPFPQYLEELEIDGIEPMNILDAVQWGQVEAGRVDIQCAVVASVLGGIAGGEHLETGEIEGSEYNCGDFTYPSYVYNWPYEGIPSGNGAEQPVETFLNVQLFVNLFYPYTSGSYWNGNSNTGSFSQESSVGQIFINDNLDFNIKDENIKKGIQNINNIARLQEITAGNLKNLVKDNLFLISGDHNEDGARVLNDYLQSLDCNKHIIVGMMANKDHESYIKCIKNISSITTVDIPNQPNAISGKELKDKFKHLPNVKYAESVEKAIKSIKLNRGDLLIITGSLYLCSEVLNLN